MLTSVTAVERFMGALRDARDLGSVLVAAVGPATADALRRAGVEADLVPAEHSARGLVEAFPDWADARSRRVLFPAADLAPATIPDGLARLGWDVRRVEAYRTVPRAATRAGAAGPGGDGRRRDVHRRPRRCRRSWRCARRPAGR